MRFKRLETVSLLSTGILMEVSPVCLLFLPLLYYFKYIDAKLHIINERYEEIVENYLKIIDDGRINDGKPTETLGEAQRYR